MIDTQRGSCAVLDIVEGDHGPGAAALLRDELIALVERTAFEVGIHTPTLLSSSAHRVVLEFAPRPAHHRRVDGFLDALATSLDRRNSSLDLRERLRVKVAVDTTSGTSDRSPASPLSAKVLAATPTSSIVVEAAERWYAAAVTPDVTYRHVCSGLETFWLRVPGRSTVPGLAPTELKLEQRPRREAPPTRNPGHRDAGAVSVTVNGNHYGDNVNGNKIIYGSPEAIGGDRPEFLTGEPRTGGIRLGGTQAEKLRAALVEAYPSFDEFAMMLREKLSQNLHRLVGANLRLDLVVSKAIERAETEGWVTKLVTAAFLGNQGNPVLRKLIETGFCDEAYAMLAAIEDPTGSVTQLRPQASLLTDLVADAPGDAARPWSGTTLETDLPEGGGLPGRAAFHLPTAGGRGPGVSGADRFLRRWHGLPRRPRPRADQPPRRRGRDQRSGAPGRRAVRLRPPRRRRRDGCTRASAFEPAGGGDWLVEASPPGEVDDAGDPTGPPTTGELDYALIRLAEQRGPDHVARRPRTGLAAPARSPPRAHTPASRC